MGKRGLEKTLKRISTLGLFIIFGLSVASATLAATTPCSITDMPSSPVHRVVSEAAGSTNALTQPPNQSNGLFSDSDCDICPNGQQVLADNFVLGSPLVVNQIVLWGGYHPGNTPLAVDDFTVIIHQDNVGIPGTVVYSESGIVPTERTDTGVDLFGVDEYRFTLDLPNPSTLPAGTYWVEIFNDTTGITDDFFWETGDQDTVNGILGSVWAVEAPGASWNIDGKTDLAFQINYVPAPTSIPTMNEWGMIILTLLIAGISIWIIKQRKTEI